MITTIQTRLKIIRTTLGLSQQEMATKLGMRQGTYSSIEIGKMRLPQRVREMLVYNLKANPLYLDDGIEPPLLSDNGTIADRIATLMTHYNMNISMFCTTLGMNEIDMARFTMMLSGKSEFTDEVLRLITDKLPIVSYQWLKENKGNMFLTRPTEPGTQQSSLTGQVSDIVNRLAECERKFQALEELNRALKDNIELYKKLLGDKEGVSG